MMFLIMMVVFSPFTAALVGVYSGKLLFNKEVEVDRNYWNKGLVILFLWALASGIVNKSIFSITGSLGILLYFFVGVVMQNYFIKINRINIVLKYLVYMSGLAALSGIMEKIVFLFMARPEHRIFSSFGNPNIAGGWFASMILIVIYLKSLDRLNKNTKKYNILMIIIVVALLLTESTGAFIALICSLVIYSLLRTDRNIRNIIVLTVVVGIVSILFMVVQNKLKAITPIGELVTSFNSRYDIWIGSIEMFLQKPIMGWGILGTLEHGGRFMPHNGNSIHSHNIWITFLVSTGVVGLLIYLYIKWNLIKDLYKLYKEKNNITPLLVSLNIMVIVQGIVDCTLYAPQLGIVFIGTGVIAYNLSNNKILKNKKDVKKTSCGKKRKDIAV